MKQEKDQRLQDIALAIGYWRRKRNMNQDELAEKTGLSYDTIKFYEQCRRTPRIVNLIKIADVLKVDLKDLVRVDDAKE